MYINVTAMAERFDVEYRPKRTLSAAGHPIDVAEAIDISGESTLHLSLTPGEAVRLVNALRTALAARDEHLRAERLRTETTDPAIVTGEVIR